jgi:tetratricopeptide (TPR) repeat protein
MSQLPVDPVSPPVFLDVATLIESSRPVRQVNWFWIVLGIFVVVTLVGNLSAKDQASGDAVQIMTAVLMVAAVVTGIGTSIMTVRRLRRQQHIVDSIDELMQLRRWEPAGMLLDRFMSAPVRSGRLWTTSLVQLASILGRHHRFEDAMKVQDFIIDNELLDDHGDYIVRLGRAMAMLHEDHLVDADRAINDLRRRGPSEGTGGLALVEIYRDVKTGHPDEAIEVFAKHLPQLQQQLGHRVADAHALVARAHDLLGRDDEAHAAYERATLLAPLSELQRRYPDVMKQLAAKYPAAIAPKEAA